jgi:predicted phage tail protein
LNALEALLILKLLNKFMKTIFSLFETQQEANEAILALNEQGYNENHLSVVAQENVLVGVDKDRSKTAEAAGKGAGIGGIVGLIAGVSSFAIPGIGLVIGAGSLIGGLLAGAGAGAVAGGIVGMFQEWLGEDKAKEYEKAVKEGHIILAAKVGDHAADNVAETLKEHGAYNIEMKELERVRA